MTLMRRLVPLLLAAAFVAFTYGCGPKVENNIASAPSQLPKDKKPVAAGGGGPGADKKGGDGTREGPKNE
jgi:hypothetical protein